MNRILVLAADEHIGAAVRDELDRASGDGRPAIKVVAPALAESRFEHAAGAVDEGIHVAEERLDASTSDLDSEVQGSPEVSAELGDADPIMAIEDALREEPCDE